MQLAAIGIQDVYITEDPEVTYFKLIHRRHTPFAMEDIEQNFSGGTADFGKRFACVVSRSGDLISKCYLRIELPAMSQTTGTVAWTRNIGHYIIDEAEILIGGQTICRHYGAWLSIWNELTQKSEKEGAFKKMIGDVSVLTDTDNVSTPAYRLWVPLEFWFCKNVGLALPLIGIQLHEVKFQFRFRQANDLYITDDGLPPTSGVPSLEDCTLFVRYIFLEDTERRQFAQAEHEYLIEQLQFPGEETNNGTNHRVKLALNHPVKELIWTVQPNANVESGANRWHDYTTSGAVDADAYIGDDPLSSAKLTLNGTDRFALMSADYFNLVQPYDFHTRGPATGIYVYSFALNPESHQPSGTANFSRIDTAELLLTLASSAASKIRVYAVNYNVLHIRSGLGGLYYAN